MKAARRRFLDATFRDSAMTWTFAHDPQIAPEGELQCELTVADVLVQHGGDMLERSDVNGTLLQIPALPGLCTADTAASSMQNADVAPSEADLTLSPRSRQSRSEAQLHLDADVCLRMSAVHWIDMAGGTAGASAARPQVHLQVRPSDDISGSAAGSSVRLWDQRAQCRMLDMAKSVSCGHMA